MMDRLKVANYGECPNCHDSRSTEIWDKDGAYTVFVCCPCEIAFDVLDKCDEYTYQDEYADHADWYYVDDAGSWGDVFGGRPARNCTDGWN